MTRQDVRDWLDPTPASPLPRYHEQSKQPTFPSPLAGPSFFLTCIHVQLRWLVWWYMYTRQEKDGLERMVSRRGVFVIEGS